MNFILDHKYTDGNTPIRPEEAEQLLPRISTMGELNEYEALNILRAREWAFDNRTMKSTEPIEEPYVRELPWEGLNQLSGYPFRHSHTQFRTHTLSML
jgi:hypothetical protein